MKNAMVDAAELFLAVTSDEVSSEIKLQLILLLKNHIKKDYVDISQVPQYLQALSIAVDIADMDISYQSFSVLCHLIRRVSMQDSQGSVLQQQSYLILPIIINKLASVKRSAKSSAAKALEAYWLCAPQQVETAILDIGLQNRSTATVIQAIVWLNHILNDINPHFKLNQFIPQLCKLLSSNNPDIYLAIEDLFVDFYNLKHNKIFRHDLEKSLLSNSVNSTITNEIMNKILDNGRFVPDNTAQIHSHVRPTVHTNQVHTNQVHNNQVHNNQVHTNQVHQVHSNQVHSNPIHSNPIHSNPIHSNQQHATNILLDTSMDSHTSLTSHQHSNHNITSISRHEPSRSSTITSRNHTPDNNSVAQKEFEDANLSPQLQSILSKINYNLDTSIPPIYINNTRHINTSFEELLLPFNGKETEHNWSLREKSIIKLRSILRGNASTDFKEELILHLREFTDGFCKSMGSLRTTLSANGCQLVKDCCIIIGVEFDVIVDSILPTLLKLCSATKQIASTNANMAICSIFLNLPFSHRYLQKILIASNEKNIQPRSYSGIWMQILLVRFHDNHAFLSSHGAIGNTGIDVATKVLIKILGDANPTVRQVAKECFWTFWDKFPNSAETLLSKLEPKIVKALEKAKPSNVDKPIEIKTSLPLRKVRPSLKESIIERNKELRLKQKSISRASSRSAMDIDLHPQESKVSTKVSPPIQKPSIGDLRSSIRKVKSSTFEANRAPIESSISTSHNSKPDYATSFSKEIPRSKSSVLPHERQNSTPPEVRPREVSPMIDLDNREYENSRISIDSSSSEKVEQLVNDKSVDPIIKFLSSNQSEYITEGISLLKYAIIADEDMSTEINGLLKSISFREPELLKTLFLSSDNLFKKCHKFFDDEDFLRICAILINPLNGNYVDLIISIINVDSLFDSIIKLLSIIINPSSIMNDVNGELGMQILKYQSVIVVSLIEFLLIGLDKIPISDSFVLKLTSNFLELVHLLKSTQIYDSFFELIGKLYKINPNLFASELDLTDKSTREEVEIRLNVGQIHGASKYGVSNRLEDLTSTEFVKGVDFSPVKSDFTMLLPVMKDNNEYTFIPKKTLAKSANNEIENIVSDSEKESKQVKESNYEHHCMEIDNQSELDDTHKNTDSIPNELHSLSQEEINLSNASDKQNEPESLEHSLEEVIANNLTIEKQTSFLEPSTHVDQSSELAEDFSQVKITESSSSGKFEDRESLQLLIEKVDPLRAISSKKKQINIFEDATGSPQKVKEYNYGEVNWFNFQLTKLSLEDTRENKGSQQQFSENNFKYLCKQLSTQTILDDTFVNVLKYIQEYKTNEEFALYFESQGRLEIESSLWDFFKEVDEMSNSLILSGLILLKLLLVNKIRISLIKLWDTLTTLYQNPQATSELYVAIGEVFDEVLVGVYSTKEILEIILHSAYDLTTVSSKYIIGILSCLLKVLSIDSTELIITEKVLTDIDNSLRPLMNHEEVEIRRYTVQIYAKLYIASKYEGESSMLMILQNLTIPQKKLVYYYSSECIG